MTNKQVRKFFEGRTKNIECPMTKELVESGYRQASGGYIKYAKENGIVQPTQYWHLIESWSKRREDDAKFTRRIQCGELIFWMAEASNAVEYDKLKELKNLIVNEYIHNRKDGNRKIQEVCFYPIVSIVEAYDKEN